MLTHIRPIAANVIKSIAFLAACSMALHADPPKGWFVAGSKPAELNLASTHQRYPTVMPVPF